MFSYDSLRGRRRLEYFLNSESKENMCQEDSHEDNFIRKVVNYFTKNSHIAYTYHFNESTDDVEYHIPRSFSGDIRNIRDYLTNSFNKKK